MTTNKSNQPSQDITNQQSQSPDKSSPVTGVIKTCTESLEKLLTPEEQKACKDSDNHFESLLIQFREEIKQVSNRIGYNYETNSYERKLGIFDNIKEKELERLLGKGFFNKNGKLRKIYQDIISQSNLSKEITKNVLMKEGLEDLILENMGEVKGQLETFEIPANIKHLIRDNPEEIGRMIKEGKYTSWDLRGNNLNQIFQNNPEVFIKFIKTIGESGIKNLDLRDNNLDQIFQNNPKAFISFIKTVGESGIRSLDLGYNKLNQIFQNNPKFFESFIKTVGKIGIKSLGLRYNNLDQIFQNDPEIFESFIKTAGESGIKNLNIGYNNLNQIFQNNPKTLLNILNIMEKGNIRYWNLKDNDITEILNSNPTFKTQFELKIEELEKKGITVIYND